MSDNSETDQYEGKVLRIDDMPDCIDIFRIFVNNTGATYLRAYGGKKGIKLAKMKQPDLIFLDTMMPILSGMETYSILKSTEQTKNIPVVFMTASAEDKEKFLAQSLPFLMKPIRQEDILEFIKRYLKPKK